MSHRTRPVHRSALTALIISLVALCAGLAPSPASAAQRLETIDLPSTQGNVDVTATQLNQANTLQANVILPDGYDAQPNTRWPVLYLLAGVGDNMTAWVKKGKVQPLVKGMPAIIVMPESGRGYFTDWWRGGQRNNPRWERYYMDEVVPAIESKYRILPGRKNHAIGGISMGAYGGVLLAGEMPTYFGTAMSLSGLLDSQAPEATYVLPLDIGSPYAKIWGPITGPYATVHNPVKVIDNVVHTRVYVSTGNGKPLGSVVPGIAAWTTGSIGEFAVWKQSQKFRNLALAAGAPIEYSGHAGVHDWPYWQKELPRAIRWGLFGSTPADDPSALKTWTFKTMAPHGNAWGLGFKFAAPTYVVETFKRDGQTLTGTGAGTVTINPGAADADASGNGSKPDCSFTAKLPFTHTLPAGC